MWKRCVFLFLILILTTGCQKPVEYKTPDLDAIIISDLHYTCDPNVIASIVPAMPYSQEVTQAVINAVIEEHPDVFIITGDNTNSGALQDMESLAGRLEQIKDAGIPIIMTTGNHDFNHGLKDQYQELFFPLLTIDEADPHSLSYYTDIGNVRILAMDDSTYTDGSSGTFSKETMTWLKKALNRAEQEGLRVLFLSHHNVLAGKKDAHNETYRITNEELEPLLRKEGVLLCISGHLHSQSILEENGLYEVIQGMPLYDGHPIGRLRIQEENIEYRCEPIDFERYGSIELAQAMKEADRKSAEIMQDIFREILEKQGIRGKEEEGILNLLGTILSSYASGTLRQEAEAIQNDPYYDAMTAALTKENYGPWIESLINDPPRDGRYLRIENE